MTHLSPLAPPPTGEAARNTALSASERARASARRRSSYLAPGAIVTICVAVHLLAATLIYRDMARDLYVLFDAAPRLLVLERGLVRLTAVSVFLPPIIPTVLLLGVALWLGGARQVEGVARWLALAAVPLAADSVLRAAGVLIAPPPSAIGELLELPTRFSIGPRMALDFAGVHPSPGVAYWVVVCTVAAAVSGWCVSQAVRAADSADVAARGHRRPRRASAIDALRAAVIVSGTWVALAFAGQVVLPWATQLFLRVFG